jgi:hypothetical protein
MDNNKESIVEIFSGTLWESEMIKSLLENSKIDSYFKNNILNSYAFEPTSSGEVKVMISSFDYETAKGIVDEYNRNKKI